MKYKEINIASRNITSWRKRKEFYTPENLNNGKNRDAMLGKLMLVVTEVAEASEAVRHNDKENFEEEIADAIIRLLDICGSMNIDIEHTIEKKMAVNEDRPIKHGKFCSL